jgi:hypothetical protein
MLPPLEEIIEQTPPPPNRAERRKAKSKRRKKTLTRHRYESPPRKVVDNWGPPPPVCHESTGPPGLTELQLNSIVSLAEAVRLSGLSDDSWRRYHRDKFIWLSPRRIGVRLRDALMIGAPPTP